MLTLDKVYKAAHVLKGVIRTTDLIKAPKICPEGEVYLKTENLQVTGSFKVRGAYFKISQLSEEEKERGVIACSAGNHAQGVALAAAKAGIKICYCYEAMVYHKVNGSTMGNASPANAYYISRNWLMCNHKYLGRKYGLFLVYYALNRCAWMIIWLLQGKTRMAGAVLQGIKDYRHGKNGKYGG